MDRRSIVKIDAQWRKKHGHFSQLILSIWMSPKKDDLLITRYVFDGDGRGWSDVFQVIENGDEKRLTLGQRYRTARWLFPNANQPTESGNKIQEKNIVAKRITGGYSQLDLLTAEGAVY